MYETRKKSFSPQKRTLKTQINNIASWVLLSATLLVLAISFFPSSSTNVFTSARRELIRFISSFEPANKMFLIATKTKPSFLLSIRDPRLLQDDFNPIFFHRVGEKLHEHFLVNPSVSLWFYDHLHSRCHGSETLIVNFGADSGFFAIYGAVLGCQVLSFEVQPNADEHTKDSMVLNALPEDTIRVHQMKLPLADPVTDVVLLVDEYFQALQTSPERIFLLKIDQQLNGLEIAKELIDSNKGRAKIFIKNIVISRFDLQNPNLREFWIWMRSHEYSAHFIPLYQLPAHQSKQPQQPSGSLEEEWLANFTKGPFSLPVVTLLDLKKRAGQSQYVDVWFRLKHISRDS